MEFEKACSEVDFILEHMNPNDLIKIPDSVKKFFKENKSLVYKVKLDETKSLKEQELKDETKAFIQIINAKYLKESKQEEKYLLDIINRYDVTDSILVENTKTTEIIVYKENILMKIIKRIRNFLNWNKSK